MSSKYSNMTAFHDGEVTKALIPPSITSVPPEIATDVADLVNTCDCEALRTAVVLFSGLNAGMLSISLVWFLFRRSKWIRKGAEAKQAEYDKLKGGQKEKKGLLSRLADALQA